MVGVAEQSDNQSIQQKTNPLRLFLIYLRLGCISFGGPVAHVGYFREEFVTRRKWLSEADYAELIALCQSVPGPSSSQLNFSIGWVRSGFAGALLAWIGFTLPSAIIMITAAYGLSALGANSFAYVDGLLIAAVAVVAKAVLGMAKSLCPDAPRGLLALLCTAIALYLPGSVGQLSVVAIGAGFGLLMYRDRMNVAASTEPSAIHFPGSRKIVLPSLLLFFGLLALSSAMPADWPGSLYAKHYQSGALVFGGGHVVLPLLNESIVATGMLSEAQFLAGYGAAQALPGPLFTISAFTGTVASGSWLGGLLALLAIFMPGMLLVAALLPIWDRYRQNRWARAGLKGLNAAVVGLLLAALITPVWSEGIQRWSDLLIATVAFAGLQKFNWPTWAVVLGCGAIGAIL